MKREDKIKIKLVFEQTYAHPYDFWKVRWIRDSKNKMEEDERIIKENIQPIV